MPKDRNQRASSSLENCGAACLTLCDSKRVVGPREMIHADVDVTGAGQLFDCKLKKG